MRSGIAANGASTIIAQQRVAVLPNSRETRPPSTYARRHSASPRRATHRRVRCARSLDRLQTPLPPKLRPHIRSKTVAGPCMGTYLSSGKVRGSRFLEWVGGPRLAVEVLAARTVDGPNPCQGRSRRRRWPKASLYKGWVHRRQSGAEFTPASGLAFHPIFRARERERLWPAPDGERPSASVEAPWGMRFSCGFSTEFAPG